MNLSDISKFRLKNQQIADTKFKTVKDIVGWMGAMQAQDFSMAKWAIGVRLPGSTDKAIQESFNKGQILRTHLLRPTWHFVSEDDIYWILELTAPHIKASLKSRNKELGLTKETFDKSNEIIERVLTGGKYFTREEIIDAIEKAKIHIDNPQAYYHLILNAELDGIICSGPIKGNKQTYALLSERVSKKKILNRNEALAELAKKYFTGHGLATLQDFVWWSGLPVADARKSLELSKLEIVSEIIGSRIYWFSKSFPLSYSSDTEKDAVYLLPAFDEFIISYKDRSASIPIENQKKAISSNGIFRPVIALNGQVIGVWKRTTKKNKTIIETHFFQSPNKSRKSLIEKEAATYGQFLNQETEIAVG
jgi:hypothetical protein